jgi:hypothetical protein
MGDYRRPGGVEGVKGHPTGQRCHTVVDIRLTSRTIGSSRLGPAPVSDGSQRQGRHARRAKLLWLSSPKRRPVLQEDPRSCLEAPARCRAVSGLGHEAVHGEMVTHGTPSMRPARPLAHSGTTDPCGRHVSQDGNDGAAARPGIAGPPDPGKGPRCPTPSPVPSAARRPGSPSGSGSAQRTARSSTSRPAA